MGLYADELAADQVPGHYSPPAERLPPRKMSASPPPSRGGPRYRSYSRSRSRSPGGGGDEGNTTVFVGNLAPDVDDRTLREFFTTWGTVLETKIIYDQETGRPRGFGFVKFDDSRDADDAIAKAHGKTLASRTLKCNMAKYPSRGGTFRGGFRGTPRGSFRGRGDGPRGGGRFGSSRRSRSPDRYSPGRYSPGRYSPGRSGSPYSSRSRSGSPPAKRRRPRSPIRPPRPGARVPRRRSRSGSYSSGSSGSSYATTDSELSRSPPRRGPPAAAAGVPPGAVAPAVGPPGAVPLPGAFKKELMQAKRRESELAARMSTLEGEVHNARSEAQSHQAQVDDLSSRLAASEKSIKKYREWLAAIVDTANSLLGAQQQLNEAEAGIKQCQTDLTLYVKEAQDLLDSTAKSHSSRRRRREKEHRGDPVAAVNGPAPGEATDVNMALAAAEAQAIAAGAAPPAAEGGWGRDVDLGGADPDLDIAAAKFKPGIKFKLAS